METTLNKSKKKLTSLSKFDVLWAQPRAQPQLSFAILVGGCFVVASYDFRLSLNQHELLQQLVHNSYTLVVLRSSKSVTCLLHCTVLHLFFFGAVLVVFDSPYADPFGSDIVWLLMLYFAVCLQHGNCYARKQYFAHALGCSLLLVQRWGFLTRPVGFSFFYCSGG